MAGAFDINESRSGQLRRQSFESQRITENLEQQSQLVTTLQLYFSFRSAFMNGQPWRIVTTFFYFGSISLDFIFHLFFLYEFSFLFYSVLP